MSSLILLSPGSQIPVKDRILQFVQVPCPLSIERLASLVSVAERFHRFQILVDAAPGENALWKWGRSAAIRNDILSLGLHVQLNEKVSQEHVVLFKIVG